MHERQSGGRAPRNESEAAIAAVFASILDLESVGIDDNFLLAGGDSLLAEQAAARIRDVFAIDLSIASILVGTVAELAAEVAAARGCHA